MTDRLTDRVVLHAINKHYDNDSRQVSEALEFTIANGGGNCTVRISNPAAFGLLRPGAYELALTPWVEPNPLPDVNKLLEFEPRKTKAKKKRERRARA